MERVDPWLGPGRHLLGVGEEGRQCRIVPPGERHHRRLHRLDLRRPCRLDERLLGRVARDVLLEFRRSDVVGLVGLHHVGIEEIANLGRHRPHHLVGDPATLTAVGMNAEVDPAGFRAQLGEAERPEARIDRLVLAGAAADTHHFGIERLRPLFDHRPLLGIALVELGVELHVFHSHLPHPERRRNTDDVDGDAELAAVLRCLIGELLVIPDLVGEGDDHDILLRCGGAVDPGAVGRGPNRRKRHLHPGVIDRHRVDRLDHLDHVVGRFLGDQRHALPERDHEILEIGAVSLGAVGAEFMENALQPTGDLLALRREAHRLVEHPHDDRRTLPERSIDLGSQAVDRARRAAGGRADRPPNDDRLVHLGSGGKLVERIDLDVTDELRTGLDWRHRNGVEDGGERLGHVG